MSRSAVEEVLGLENTRLLWTGNYEKVLPISIQIFDLSAILPAVFYMFRFGWQRGNGRFLATFAAGETGKEVTIEQVAAKLSQGSAFVGFDSDVGQAILGDLLLCFCLENGRRAPGRREKMMISLLPKPPLEAGPGTQGKDSAGSPGALSGLLGRSAKFSRSSSLCPRNDGCDAGEAA